MMLLPINPVTECGGACGCEPVTKESIGLGNVDNTADLYKPISIAVQEALNGKANLSEFVRLDNEVTAIDYRVTNIENAGGIDPQFTERFEIIEATVATHTTDIENLQSRVTTLESNDGTHNTKIASLEASDVAINNKVNALQANDVLQDGKITTIEGNITSIEGDITSIEGDITSIEGDITSLGNNKADKSNTPVINSANIGTNTKPVKIVNGNIVEVTSQLVKALGNSTFSWGLASGYASVRVQSGVEHRVIINLPNANPNSLFPIALVSSYISGWADMNVLITDRTVNGFTICTWVNATGVDATIDVMWMAAVPLTLEN